MSQVVIVQRIVDSQVVFPQFSQQTSNVLKHISSAEVLKMCPFRIWAPTNWKPWCQSRYVSVCVFFFVCILVWKEHSSTDLINEVYLSRHDWMRLACVYMNLSKECMRVSPPLFFFFCFSVTFTLVWLMLVCRSLCVCICVSVCVEPWETFEGMEYVGGGGGLLTAFFPMLWVFLTVFFCFVFFTLGGRLVLFPATVSPRPSQWTVNVQLLCTEQVCLFVFFLSVACLHTLSTPRFKSADNINFILFTCNVPSWPCQSERPPKKPASFPTFD